MRAWLILCSLLGAFACAKARSTASDDDAQVEEDGGAVGDRAVDERPASAACDDAYGRPLTASRFVEGIACFKPAAELQGLCQPTPDASASSTGDTACVIVNGAIYVTFVRWGEMFDADVHHSDTVDLDSTLTRDEQSRCDALFETLRETPDVDKTISVGGSPGMAVIVGPACAS